MKKLFAIILLIVSAYFLVGWAKDTFFPEQKSVYVPVTVAQGDTLFDICLDLSLEYGDRRDVQEIVHYVRKQNNIDSSCIIRPGQKLVIELKVNK